MSPVNKKIFEKFGSVKSNLLDNECTILQTNVREVKELMTVLLVQGATRSIYELDIHDDFQETTQAMGAAFAAAVLPLLHACSEGYAMMVHNDLSPGKSTKGSYEVVKNALEQNYVRTCCYAGSSVRIYLPITAARRSPILILIGRYISLTNTLTHSPHHLVIAALYFCRYVWVSSVKMWAVWLIIVVMDILREQRLAMV